MLIVGEPARPQGEAIAATRPRSPRHRPAAARRFTCWISNTVHWMTGHDRNNGSACAAGELLLSGRRKSDPTTPAITGSFSRSRMVYPGDPGRAFGMARGEILSTKPKADLRFAPESAKLPGRGPPAGELADSPPGRLATTRFSRAGDFHAGVVALSQAAATDELRGNSLIPGSFCSRSVRLLLWREQPRSLAELNAGRTPRLHRRGSLVLLLLVLSLARIYAMLPGSKAPQCSCSTTRRASRAEARKKSPVVHREAVAAKGAGDSAGSGGFGGAPTLGYHRPRRLPCLHRGRKLPTKITRLGAPSIGQRPAAREPQRRVVLLK